MENSVINLCRMINAYLNTHLAVDCDQNDLTASMRYSLMAKGKRLRPALTLAFSKSLGQPIDSAHLRAASAVELLHTYSLIHDDLPAMDNDSLRRGKLTNHLVYGAGMAILAGDGLLTLAFQWLSDNELPMAVRLALIRELALAAGPKGMVAGQASDIVETGHHLSLAALQQIHQKKTGALLRYAALAGGIMAEAPSEVLEELAAFGSSYGLAFQIYDDYLDATATDSELGKKVHKDSVNKKNTCPGLVGLDSTRQILAATLRDARMHLDRLADKTGRDFSLLDSFLAYFK